MAKLSILFYPSPVILKKSLPVTSIDGELQRFIDDMVETMYAAQAWGLPLPKWGHSGGSSSWTLLRIARLRGPWPLLIPCWLLPKGES
jgi:hypothetical protein